MKKKLMIYPYSKELSFVLSNKDLLEEYTIFSIVLSVGETMDNKLLDNINVQTDFKANLNCIDTVLFVDDSRYDISIFQENITYAIDNGKDVLLTPNLSNRINKIEGKQVKLLDINLSVVNEEPFPTELKYIDVPVIFVYGLGENCSKMDTQLSLRKYFIGKGHSVLQFGTHETSCLFGFKKLPEFIYVKGFSLEEKIFMFNDYIHKYLKQQRYDILVIGVPGGILPYNDVCFNHFGEIAYIISNAIKPDISILNTYFFYGMTPKYLKLIRECCLHKFDSLINYFAISDTSVQCNRDNDLPEMHWFHTSQRKLIEYVKNNLADEEINIFSIDDKQKLNEIFNQIYNELENNIEVL